MKPSDTIVISDGTGSHPFYGPCDAFFNGQCSVCHQAEFDRACNVRVTIALAQPSAFVSFWSQVAIVALLELLLWPDVYGRSMRNRVFEA